MSHRRTLIQLVLTASLSWFSAGLSAAADGSDLEFGGPGSEPGRFDHFRDLTIDAQGMVYTLEGMAWDAEAERFHGNGRIQKFDAAGTPLLQIPLDRSQPASDVQRLAVAGDGTIYVTDRGADRVLVYAADGSARAPLDLPYASAIARWRGPGFDRVAVLPYAHRIVDGRWVHVGGDTIVPIEDGSVGSPIPLEQTLTGVGDLATGPDGDFYVIADHHQLYRFGSDGRLKQAIGTGEKTRVEDGSELLHTVGVDSAGHVYSFTWGNPGRLARFSPDFTEVRLRQGQFKWADPWGAHSHYTPLAIGPDDRVWVASTHQHDPKGPNFHKYQAVPAVLRTEAAFFDEERRGVTVNSTLGLGFKPRLDIDLPVQGVAYGLDPVEMHIVVAPSRRRIDAVRAEWKIYDLERRLQAEGGVDLSLVDGQEARSPISFTPERLGWYLVSCSFETEGVELSAFSRFFGVTERYPGMLALSDEQPGGGMPDPVRGAFCGLMNQRLHIPIDPQRWPELEARIAACEQAGATWFVQFTDRHHCDPDFVRKAVQHFRGRVPVWEIMNEPNFSYSPDEYAAMLKQVYPIIKEIDPVAQVMAPNVCGIDIGWHEKFYQAGCAGFFDILSIHDYEGHETIDPVHWRWKIGALRELMARFGDGDKPMWQTERGINGVRGDNWLGGTQAVRMTLHRDLLETLGIAPEHNNHFYLNDHGFSDFPSWVWAKSGPHPAVFALRVRHALTTALGRAYQGTVDFGPVGDKLLLGLRYVGADGSTIIVRNLGSQDIPLTFTVSGSSLAVADAFGNRRTLDVRDGRVTIPARQMPTYLLPARDQSIEAPRLDFGRNLAPLATISCDTPGARDTGILNNGILEVINAGHPHGGTDGKAIWSVGLVDRPVVVELEFADRLPISSVLLHGLHADNSFCSLRNYDLECWDGDSWQLIESFDAAIPPSESSSSAYSGTIMWTRDDNRSLHRFEPVLTDRLRVVVKQTTNGFVSDQRARAWGNIIPRQVMLREIEVYAAPSPVRAEVVVAPATLIRPEPVVVTISARNQGPALQATARVTAPQGWTVEPMEVVLSLPAQGTAQAEVILRPGDVVPTGRATVSAVLSADDAHLDVGWADVAIAPPLQLKLVPLPAISVESQPMQVEVHNSSDQAVGGTLALALVGPRSFDLDQAFGPLAPGEQTRVQFEIPGIDLFAEPWTARWTAIVDGRSISLEQDLSVRAWRVFGPFPNEFDTDFGPESGVDLGAATRDRVGKEIEWRMVVMESNGYLDLRGCFDQTNNVCAYAAAWVRVPEARSGRLVFGTDDGAKLWLNGEQIHSDNGSHGASPDQSSLAVELKQGWNEVLFKVFQGSGGWGLFCRLAEDDGSAMSDAVWSPTAPR